MSGLLLAKHWPYAVIAILLALLAVGAAGRSADKAALTAAAARMDRFAADVRANTATAHATDVAHARRVEAAQSTITQETSRDLATQLADARADAAAYARRLREQAATADRGGGGTANLPRPAGGAGGITGAGGATLLDGDVRICAENTVKAQGWQDWWKGQTNLRP